jgi:phytoene dehydrogenase-like protein
MANAYDAMIIGAGHNGLTTAAYLAKAGLKILALERRPVVGGAVVTEEIFPGFKFDTCAHGGQLRPDIVRDLGLAQHGLEVVTTSSSLFVPQSDGRQLLLSQGIAQTVESIERFSRADAKQWPAFVALLSKVAALLNEAYALTPPRVPAITPAEMPALAQLGLKLRGFGRKDMVEAIRLLPMSVAELLDEWFESDALKGAVGAFGVHGVMQGPMSGGTAFVLLHHWAINGGLFRPTVRGGMGQIANALANAARAWGAEIRTGAEVAQITVQDGKAIGVALASGEEINGRLVISNADPRRTFVGNHVRLPGDRKGSPLLDPLELDPSFVRAVQNIRMRGASAKVNLALNGLPQFTAAPDASALRGTIVVSPSLKYLERAYDAAKYGSYSPKPYLEIVLPSVNDPSLAPEGKHVMSIFAQYAPYHLKEGTWAERREALRDVVINTLTEYAPNLQSLISNLQVLAPLDLEEQYGLTEGNIHHGEMMLDQILFMRPVPGWAQYRTPIENLYLCGAGTHPGGGVSGASGRNAARQILKDIR